MKKFLALLVAMLLLTSFAVAESTTITFDEASIANIEGEWVGYEGIDVDFFMPKTLAETELTDEQIDAGIIAIFTTADQSAAVAMNANPANGATIATAFENLKAQEGMAEVALATINGLDAITYTVPAADVAGVVVIVNEVVITFTFGPMSNADFVPTAGIILSSIKPFVAE